MLQKSGMDSAARTLALATAPLVLLAVLVVVSAFGLGCASDHRDPYLEEARAELDTRTFECGDERCALDVEYCIVHLRASGEGNYSCEPVPAFCRRSSVCTCLEATRCYDEGGRATLDVNE